MPRPNLQREGNAPEEEAIAKSVHQTDAQGPRTSLSHAMYHDVPRYLND